MKYGNIFEIQRFCTHDGRGIRTTVFFKGCGMRCAWCSNPESQSSGSELFYRSNGCITCGLCAKCCPENAIQVLQDCAHINRSACTHCMQCISVCPAALYQSKLSSLSSDEVLEIVLRDREFYQASGGGLTLSGGECLLQADFALELLHKAKRHGLHTAIETSLNAPFELLDQMLPLLDEIFFDLKHVDSEKHRQWTGASNHIILNNILRLAALRPDALPRIPIIPGFNDTAREIRDIATFLQHAGFQRAELLAYHTLGASKYIALGRANPYENIVPFSEPVYEQAQNIFSELGLEVISN